jgi:hypothetical protein
MDILAKTVRRVENSISVTQEGRHPMIALLIAVALLQGPSRLQPGAGIVTGSIQFEGGGSAAGVRVAAMAMDDPSSIVSIAETDASGHYQLTNIPAGQYFVVAGRLNDLTYFPGGKDRSNATLVTVDAAKITNVAPFNVPSGSKRPVAPGFGSPQTDPGVAAYGEIKAEKNPETKKKLLLNFEKNFPKSSRLAEVYIDLSRVLASQNNFKVANDYAEKAVAAVARLKAETSTGFDQTYQNWVISVETSARDNLAWTKQMVAWQQKQLNATVLRRR